MKTLYKNGSYTISLKLMQTSPNVVLKLFNLKSNVMQSKANNK